MQLKFLIILGLSLAAPLSGACQNIVRISSREGMSNSSILSVAQDADGYIWAGSCEGLNLWDGKQVRNYKLSGNLIHEIIPTRDGMFWVRTNYGFDLFDPREKISERHARFNRPYTVTARSREEAFLVHEGRLYGYNPMAAEFEPVEMTGREITLDRKTRLFIDRGSSLWIVRPEGLYRYEIKRSAEGRCSAHEAEFIPVHKGIVFSRGLGESICFLDRNRVLYCFDPETGTLSVLFDLKGFEGFNNDGLTAIERDGDDWLLAFRNGLWRLSPRGPAGGGGYESHRIPVNGSIFSLLKDRNQDIVWIGTDGNGLLRQYNEGVRINSVVYESLPYPLSKPIKALHIDDGDDLWIGTKNDGILRIRDFYDCETYTRKNTLSYTTANSALRHNAVYAFARSSRNVLWIATDGGISYYSYAAGRIVPLTDRNQLQSVHALYEDAEGVLWAATVGNGVYRLRIAESKGTLRVAELRSLNLGEEALKMNFFFSIKETDDESLWFCNHGFGVFRYDRKNDRAEEIAFDPQRGLPVNDVTAMTACSDNTLWFGTGYGITCYDNAAGKEKPTPRYGNELLRSGVIHGIIADTLDNLWVSTNAGIVRYTPATNRSVSYDSSYGLDVVEFSDGAEFYDRRTGRLLFGGNNGFVVISGTQHPVAAESYKPPILFRSLLIGGKEYSLAGLMRQGCLTLPHRQASFALSLIALDYIHGGNYSYLYNLEDDEHAWVDNSRNSQLIFVNLPPGVHTLRVRYRNDTTSELSPVSTLKIRIRPPVYASWWAVAIYLAAFAGCSLLLVRYLRIRHKVREQRKHAIYERQYHDILYKSRINTFTNLTTDLALPLTLINGPCQQILDHRTTDGVVRQWAELIRANACKINDLVYLIHSLTRDLDQECDDKAEWVDVSRLAENISQTFFDRAEIAEVEYRVSIAPKLLFPSVPHLLTTIINLMITNAFGRSDPFRHGSVSFSAGMQGDRLRLAVSAQGRKLDRDQLFLISDLHRFLDYLGSDRHVRPIRNDMELAICHNLVAKLHGEFDIGDDGSALVVSLPQLPITQAVPDTVQEPSPETAPLPDETLRLDQLLPSMLLISEDREMETFIASLFKEEYDVHFYHGPDSLDEASWRIVLCNPIVLNDGMLGIIRTIRQAKRFKLVPVILLTATPHPELKLMESGVDVDLCLSLPFNIGHLRNAVNRQMRRYDSFRDIDDSVYGSFDMVQGRMLQKEDRDFLNKMLEIIQQHIFKPELSTHFIAAQMGVSKTTFYNRIGTITSHSPVSIIKEFRLGYAERLLVQTRLSIDEIIYKSGFVNRSTFFRNFSARYGCTPKIYREQKIAEIRLAAKAAE